MNTTIIFVKAFLLIILLLLLPDKGIFAQTSGEKNITTELITVNVIEDDDGNWQWVELNWNLSGGNSAGYFEIHRLMADETFMIVADNIAESEDTWIDKQAQPSAQSEWYYVVYINEPLQVSESSNVHGTIFLNPAPDVDYCNQHIILDWTNYFTSVDQYNLDPANPFFTCNKIFVSINGEAWQQAYELVFQHQTYPYLNVQPGNTYRFRVQACESGSRISSSNATQEIAFAPDWPSLVQIDWVNVKEGGLELGISSDGNYPGLQFNIFRLSQITGNYELIDSVPLADSVVFEDINTNTDIGPWFYRVSVFNNCNLMILDSEEASSIFLQLDRLELADERIDLTYSWEHMPAWSTYVLEHKRSPTEPFSPLGGQTFPAPGSRRLNEDISLIEDSGELFLRMAATDGPVSIHSNVVRITLEPEVTAPKAFRPNSHLPANRVFRPGLNLTPATYDFRVYNRWQQLIFSSNDPAEAWDGTWNGEAVPEGVYAWVLEYQIASGKKHNTMGSVMLVR